MRLSWEAMLKTSLKSTYIAGTAFPYLQSPSPAVEGNQIGQARLVLDKSIWALPDYLIIF